MHTSVPPDLFTLASLAEYSARELAEHPERAGYHIEIRDHLLAAPPHHVTHDDQARVVILLGVPCR